MTEGFVIGVFIVMSFVIGHMAAISKLADEYCTKSHELKADYDACVERIEDKGFKE